MPKLFLKLIFKDTSRSRLFELHHKVPFGHTEKGIVYNTHQPPIAIFYRKPKWEHIILKTPELSLDKHVIPVPDLETLSLVYHVWVPSEKCMQEPDGTTTLIITDGIDKKWIGNVDSEIQQEINNVEKELKKLQTKSVEMIRSLLKFVETQQVQMMDLGLDIERTVMDANRMIKRMAEKQTKTERVTRELEELEGESEEEEEEPKEVKDNATVQEKKEEATLKVTT